MSRVNLLKVYGSQENGQLLIDENKNIFYSKIEELQQAEFEIEKLGLSLMTTGFQISPVDLSMLESIFE
jgi:hypothetical protein